MKKSKTPKQNQAPAWDTLNAMGAEMDVAVTAAVHQITPLLLDRELNAAVEDREALLNWGHIYKRDIIEYQQTLNNIREQHKDRTGEADIEEMFECLNLYEQYVEWQSKFMAVVMPTVNAILNAYQIAGEKLQAQKLEAQQAQSNQETPDVP